MTDHTVKSFGEQLEALSALVAQMGGLAEAQFASAIEAIARRDSTAAERPEYIPLSFSQERLWFIDRLEGSVQYHLPAVLRLKGELNREALERTLRHIISRHQGRLNIESKLGEGSVFTVLLPAAPAEIPAKQAAPEPVTEML